MQAILLAAGESSRFWPLSAGKHKSLLSIMGQPLIVWTLRTLEAANIKEVIVIQSATKNVEEALSDFDFDLEISYRVQDVALGMGDALLKCKEDLREDFLLLHAHQFTADRWIPEMLTLKSKSSASAVLTGQRTTEPQNYGIFALDGDRATGIIEKAPAGEAPQRHSSPWHLFAKFGFLRIAC